MAKDERLAPPQQYHFGEFELRPEDAALYRRGCRIRLQPQPYRVLAYLLARSPAIVTRNELGEHVWEPGVHVDLDQSLNYCIRQIRQTLNDSATVPRYVETLPRQGYRFICPVEVVVEQMPESSKGLELAQTDDPVAPLSGNSFQESPPSSADAGSSHGMPSGPARRGRRLGYLAGFALVAFAVLFLVWKRHPLHRANPSSHVESLAVLPIQNLSGDPAQDYLADGLTEELTTTLTNDSTLRVVSRTSATQYKDAHLPLPQIAHQLGADAVLEGSLARTGTRTHITLQLIRADTDSHLWAQSYDRDTNDATVAGQAAQSIAQRLGKSVQFSQKPRFIAPAAHDAYLRGRYLWPTERMAESGEYFKKAIEIQPDYAEAWAGLANYYGEGIAGGVLDPRTNMPFEEQAAERALALAPNLAHAHQAVGAALFLDRWDWQNADREILLAISLDPNDASTYYLRANLLEAVGRFDEALQVEKKSMELDPFERREALAAMYVEARLYDDALADIKLRLEAAPNDPALHYTAADVWRRKGNYGESSEAWARYFLATGSPGDAASVRRAYQHGGARGVILWQLNTRLRQARSQYVSPIELASYYAQLKDREHTLPLLEEGFRQRSTDCLWISDDPAYEFLHADPRYQTMLKQLNLRAAA